ncbi:ribonuclease H-like domain-containing protein, partial [Tanacetum coccineum]
PSVDVSKDDTVTNNFSIFEQRGSSGNVVSKPWVKFVKGTGCPNAIKVNNTKSARKPTVKYAEMYRNTSKSPRAKVAADLETREKLLRPQLIGFGNLSKTLLVKGNIDDKGYWDSGCSRHMTGIKREFSNARTPQQNGVAERRNRTLLKAARTMLADAKLRVTFWAEAVSTACYVQNRVFVNDSQFYVPIKYNKNTT